MKVVSTKELEDIMTYVGEDTTEEADTFTEWWKTYIRSNKCPLDKTRWFFSELTIIKEAMNDAFLHK